MRRILRLVRAKLGATLVVVAGLAAASTLAFALSLNATSKSIAAGGASVSPCDSDGVTASLTRDTSDEVTSVTVSGIDAVCSGQVLKVALVRASGEAVGTGQATVTGSSVTVAIAAKPLVGIVAATKLAIEE